MSGPPHRSSVGFAASAGRRGRRPQGFGPEHRLRRRQDYLRAYRTGRRRGGRFATLFFVANDLENARLGITASRKVGNSVVRQRLKRRVREIFRRWERRADLPPLDLVVNLKPDARQGSFVELHRELVRQLDSLLPGAARPDRSQDGPRRRQSGQHGGGSGPTR